MMSPIRTRLLPAADGLVLSSETFGAPVGQPLLLIMGAMNQGLFWPDEFCTDLAEAGFFVIRYDHRDTGASSLVDYAARPYTLDDLTADALAILDGYGVGQADVVGLSMGGYIAQLLAARQPGRVRRLVLLSTTADHRPYMAATQGESNTSYDLPSPSPEFLAFVDYARRHPPPTAVAGERLALAGWRATHGGSRPFPEAAVLALIRRAAGRTRDPIAPFNHALAVAASPPRTDLLPAIQVPTLVLHGVADPCLPLAHGRHLADHIAGARLVILDMGHMLPPTQTAEAAALMIEFLAEGGAQSLPVASSQAS